jgi:hypothetical protein
VAGEGRGPISAKDVTRRAHRGPWCARSSPRGPTRIVSAASESMSAWGDGLPPLGIP